jgi:hypothetical protein
MARSEVFFPIGASIGPGAVGFVESGDSIKRLDEAGRFSLGDIGIPACSLLLTTEEQAGMPISLLQQDWGSPESII